jgi:hypothetical protein
MLVCAGGRSWLGTYSRCVGSEMTRPSEPCIVHNMRTMAKRSSLLILTVPVKGSWEQTVSRYVSQNKGQSFCFAHPLSLNSTRAAYTRLQMALIDTRIKAPHANGTHNVNQTVPNKLTGWRPRTSAAWRSTRIATKEAQPKAGLLIDEGGQGVIMMQLLDFKFWLGL